MVKNISIPRKTKTQLITEFEDLSQRATELETAKEVFQQMVLVLQESIEKYSILLDESSDPIFMFYPDGTYTYANKAFADGVGKKIEEIIEKKIWDVFPKEEADKRYAAVKWVFEHGQTKIIEVLVPRPDGNRYYLTTIKPVMTDEKIVTSVVCISKDITDRKKMEEELRFLSTHDFLTNLYNRNFFEVEMERIQDSRLFPVSIVMIDVDKLKSVNDQYGHAAGDVVIRRIAQLLKESFRNEDIIARYGGDEFIILLPETDETALESVLTRLHANMEQQSDSRLSISIGSSTGGKGCLLPELINLADDRMYREKFLARNKVARRA